MESGDRKFSSFLPIEVFTREIGSLASDWAELDIGPGIFHVPANHEVMIRVRNIDDQFLKALVAEIKDLSFVTALNLSENRKVTDKGLLLLEVLSQFKELNLSSCDISDHGFPSIVKLKHLQRLNVTYCNRVTDAGIKLLKDLRDLEFLDLQGLPKITNGSLSKIRKSSLVIHR